jgi:hypothetical protein
MRRVYVLNDGGHDYSDAERFGSIVFCTRGSLARWDISQMFRELKIAMLDASPDDFILVSSLASLVGVASAVMASRFGEVHYLIFKDGQYVQRDLMLENGE